MRVSRRVRTKHSPRDRQRAKGNARKLHHETLEGRYLLAQTTGLFFDNPGTSADYTLISPNTSNTTYLIDKHGNLVHQWVTPYAPGLLGYLLPDGSLIRDGSPHGQGGNGSISAAGAGGLLQRFDWNGNLIWQYAYDSPAHLAHHDFHVLPNGNVLIVAWENKTEADATAAGRDPNLPGPGYLYPDSVVEVHPDLINGGGTIVWEWHVWDHLVQQFDNTKANYYGATGVHDHPELINLNYVSTGDDGAGAGEDWNHTNGIEYDAAQDQIILSVREFSEVWVIDHSTTSAQAAGHTGGRSGHGGDLLYRWGNPQTYDRGTDADRILYYQHNPELIPAGYQGAGDLTVFNNGVGRPGTDFNEVEEFTRPTPDGNGNYPLAPGGTYGPAASNWTYVGPAANFSPIISGAQRLANGNTLVSYGVMGTFTEITPGGQEVWRYVNPYTGAGTLGPNDPIPSLGISDPLLNSLLLNFTFHAVDYPMSYVTQLPSTVVGRMLFYKGSSRYDTTGNSQTPLPFSDDNAIATDKVAYIANNAAATFGSISSFSSGITGIMIDLAGAHGSLSASDFIFKTGNNNNPGSWTTLAAPTTVSVRAGAGAGGSDRIELTWANNTIQKTWLEVIAKGNDTLGGHDANTNLAASDVFFFGSAKSDTGLGDSPTVALVSGADITQVQSHQALPSANIPLTNLYDFNRDGQVNGQDITLVEGNQTSNTTGLKLIVLPVGSAAELPSALPAATPGGASDDGIASALSLAVANPTALVGNAAVRFADPPVSGEASRVPMLGYFGQLAGDGTTQSEEPWRAVDATADTVEVDDELLDVLATASTS